MSKEVVQHTPGQWGIRVVSETLYGETKKTQTYLFIHVVPATPNDRISSLICKILQQGSEPSDGEFADARLIAASPDLLEAVQTMVALLDVGAKILGNNAAGLAEDRLRCALQKASGSRNL